jgi:hypothetical protein
VVAVQVADTDQIHEIRIQTEAPHRDQRRGPAVDQGVRRAVVEVHAGLEAAPAAEGIAATQELKTESGHGSGS